MAPADGAVQLWAQPGAGLAFATIASVLLVAVRVRRQLKELNLHINDTASLAERKKRFDTSVRYLAEAPPSMSVALLDRDASIGKEIGQQRFKRIMHKKLIVAMVGLPARGKSYIVKMLLRYMSFCKGIGGKVFNVGDYRRKHGLAGVGSTFFNAENQEAMKAREHMAHAVLGEALAWLEEAPNNRIAIFDATNTTVNRREMIKERLKTLPHLGVMFIESICDDHVVLNRNYRLKLQNADYKGRDPEQALHDFLERVRAYEAVYEPVEDSEVGGQASYVKIYNVGDKIAARNCSGFLQSCISYYLQNIHVSPRRIWICQPAEARYRHAGHSGAGLTLDLPPTSARSRLRARRVQSDNTLLGHGSPASAQAQAQHRFRRSPSPSRIAYDDSVADWDIEITKEGRQFALDLCRFVVGEVSQGEKKMEEGPTDEIGCVVLTAPDKRSAATIEHLSFVCSVQETSLLRPLHYGDLTDLSLHELELEYADVLDARNADPLNFRYPGAGGESYLDCIQRLEPLIVELERQRRDVVVVAALEVAQCIYGYFMGYEQKDVPHINLNPHCVYELRPGPFRTEEEVIMPGSYF